MQCSISGGPARVLRGLLGAIVFGVAMSQLAGWEQMLLGTLGLMMLFSAIGNGCGLAGGASCAPNLRRADEPARPDELRQQQLSQLHHQAIDRDYDLRTCNPDHGPFYGFMARYKASADDAPALHELAGEIAPWADRPQLTPDMRSAYAQLGDLVRWRIGELRAEAVTR